MVIAGHGEMVRVGRRWTVQFGPDRSGLGECDTRLTRVAHAPLTVPPTTRTIHATQTRVQEGSPLTAPTTPDLNPRASDTPSHDDDLFLRHDGGDIARTSRSSA